MCKIHKLLRMTVVLQIHFILGSLRISLSCEHSFTRVPRSMVIERDNICYELHTLQVTRNEANYSCSSRGGTLVTVDSDAKQQMLAGVLYTQSVWHSIWIGAIRSDVRSTWLWERTGQPLNYNHWVNGEPRSGNNNACSYMSRSARWRWRSTTNCNSTANAQYICQFETTGRYLTQTVTSNPITNFTSPTTTGRYVTQTVTSNPIRNLTSPGTISNTPIRQSTLLYVTNSTTNKVKSSTMFINRSSQSSVTSSTTSSVITNSMSSLRSLKSNITPSTTGTVATSNISSLGYKHSDMTPSTTNPGSSKQDSFQDKIFCDHICLGVLCSIFGFLIGFSCLSYFLLKESTKTPTRFRTQRLRDQISGVVRGSAPFSRRNDSATTLKSDLRLQKSDTHNDSLNAMYTSGERTSSFNAFKGVQTSSKNNAKTTARSHFGSRSSNNRSNFSHMSSDGAATLKFPIFRKRHGIHNGYSGVISTSRKKTRTTKEFKGRRLSNHRNRRNTAQSHALSWRSAVRKNCSRKSSGVPSSTTG